MCILLSKNKQLDCVPWAMPEIKPTTVWPSFQPWSMQSWQILEFWVIHLLFKKTHGTSSCSVTQSCPTFCNPMGLQHARFLCPSPSPGACSNSCPLSQWCHPTTSSSVVPSSSCLHSFQASGSSLMSQVFTSVTKVLDLQY